MMAWRQGRAIRGTQIPFPVDPVDSWVSWISWVTPHTLADPPPTQPSDLPPPRPRHSNVPALCHWQRGRGGVGGRGQHTTNHDIAQGENRSAPKVVLDHHQLAKCDASGEKKKRAGLRSRNAPFRRGGCQQVAVSSNCCSFHEACCRYTRFGETSRDLRIGWMKLSRSGDTPFMSRRKYFGKASQCPHTKSTPWTPKVLAALLTGNVEMEDGLGTTVAKHWSQGIPPHLPSKPRNTITKPYFQSDINFLQHAPCHQ